MLRENIIDNSGHIVVHDKVQKSIKWLKSFEPPDGYWYADSGGKDSCVVGELLVMAGVKFEGHYSLTTVDPPELVRFIKERHPSTIIDRPKETMWQLIVRYRMPPTRVARYCCEELKESSGKGRVTVTGIRWAESVKRKIGRHLVDIGGKGGVIHNDDNDESRRAVEQCYRTQKTLINPIIDWSDDDVWEFIKSQNIPYCCLYDQGFRRLGCIGCPQGRAQRIIDFQRWPTYKTAYIHAFDRMIAARRLAGLPDPTNYSTGQECFDWWVSDERNSQQDELTGQIEIEDQPNHRRTKAGL